MHHLQKAATALEQLFRDFQLNQQLQFTLLKMAIRPFLTPGEGNSPPRRLETQIFEPDHIKLQFTPMQTPLKSQQPEIIHWTPTPIRSSCHPNNLMSQLRGESIASFQKVSKNVQKMKKRELLDSLNAIRDCVVHLASSVHRAYNHLSCWRYGKQSKFQADAIFARRFGRIIEKLNNFKINGGVEEAVKNMTKQCSQVVKAIPQYEKEFIKPQEEINWPSPSQILSSRSLKIEKK